MDRLKSDIRTVADLLPDQLRQRVVYQESLALKLHNYYSGWERIFAGIATDLNGGVPQNGQWRRRLLDSMTLQLPDVGPTILSATTETALLPYLAFRHGVRNVYGFEIERNQQLPDVSFGSDWSWVRSTTSHAQNWPIARV